MKPKPPRYLKKPYEIFWHFINERHRIYLKKKEHEASKDKEVSPWPWTKDKILREYKFTNVYRQLDRVTEAWTNRWITLLHRGNKMTDGDVLFNLCMFRFFNWPATYDALYYGDMPRWRLKTAIKILQKRKDEDHEQLFTGAYIVTGGGLTQDKHVTICEALDYVYENRKKLARQIVRSRSMEKSVEILTEIPTVGKFVAYELVCDLRHTRILADALDINSWANPGPGAKRGIHRLLCGIKDWNKDKKPDYVLVMRDLLQRAKKECGAHVFKCEWPFEMREIEHSLCEADKYMRVKNGEGRPRSRYHYRERLEFGDEE